VNLQRTKKKLLQTRKKRGGKNLNQRKRKTDFAKRGKKKKEALAKRGVAPVTCLSLSEARPPRAGV